MTITETLQEWLKDPSQLADEGLDPPTLKSIRIAMALTEICPTFARVVPDGAGGVVLKRFYGGHVTHTVKVKADGSFDFMRWNEEKIDIWMQWTLERDGRYET